jgi:uroporphyrinogen decarboxylase
MTALNWQEPDRAPIQTYLTPEMRRTLQDHFGVEDVRVPLGVDFREVHPVYPPGPPPRDGLTFDMWGAGYRTIRHSSAGTYDEAVLLPLADLHTLDEVERYPWPNLEAADFSAVRRQAQAWRDQGYVVITGHAGMPDILNGVSRGRGMEQVVIDVATRDEVGLAIIARRVDLLYELARRTLEAADGLIDILHIGEDTGNQLGRMFSPADFDAIFRPALQRFIDLGHQHGCRVMMHSCGDTHDLQPTFMAMGLDILDAMQPEPPGMANLEELRRMTRRRLAYCGLISTQQTLPHGTVEDCRREARHRLDVIGRGGGYIFSPAHCIQPDTPLANVLAVYEEALGRPL